MTNNSIRFFDPPKILEKRYIKEIDANMTIAIGAINSGTKIISLAVTVFDSNSDTHLGTFVCDLEMLIDDYNQIDRDEIFRECTIGYLELEQEYKNRVEGSNKNYVN